MALDIQVTGGPKPTPVFNRTSRVWDEAFVVTSSTRPSPLASSKSRWVICCWSPMTRESRVPYLRGKSCCVCGYASRDQNHIPPEWGLPEDAHTAWFPTSQRSPQQTCPKRFPISDHNTPPSRPPRHAAHLTRPFLNTTHSSPG